MSPDLGHWMLNAKHEPVRCTMKQWAVFFENIENRQVEETKIDDVRISTVFLGLDHNWSDQGSPILFETMVFGGEHHDYMDRCCTWDEALKMHKRAVWIVRGADKAEIGGGAA